MSARRPLLLTLVAAGSVTCLAGAGGVFASFTDRATGGTNSVESGAARHAADLQIGTFNGESCGDFADDTETAVFVFDETLRTFCARAEKIGLAVRRYIDDGALLIRQIDSVVVEMGRGK